MGRGKGRNSNDSSNCVNGEEVKIPVQKKRGRPLKHLKEQQVHKTNEVDKDNVSFIHKSPSDDVFKKMKMKFESNEKEEHSKVVKEESGDEIKLSSFENEQMKSSGFRQNSSRRKNKPRRAAEAVVECC